MRRRQDLSGNPPVFLSCPFCGGPPKINGPFAFYDSGLMAIDIQCSDCSVRMIVADETPKPKWKRTSEQFVYPNAKVMEIFRANLIEKLLSRWNNRTDSPMAKEDQRVVSSTVESS